MTVEVTGFASKWFPFQTAPNVTLQTLENSRKFLRVIGR